MKPNSTAHQSLQDCGSLDSTNSLSGDRGSKNRQVLGTYNVHQLRCIGDQIGPITVCLVDE